MTVKLHVVEMCILGWMYGVLVGLQIGRVQTES